MKIFIKIKAGLLFFLVFVAPVLISCIYLLLSASIHDPAFDTYLLDAAFITIGLGLLMHFLWSVSAFQFLLHVMPYNPRVSVFIFQLGAVMVLALFLVISYMAFEYNGGLLFGMRDSTAIAIMVLCALGVTAAIAYNHYFIAKSVKTVETQQMVKFSAFAAEFMYLLLFPFGLWKIQPRLNIIASVFEE